MGNSRDRARKRSRDRRRSPSPRRHRSRSRSEKRRSPSPRRQRRSYSSSSRRSSTPNRGPPVAVTLPELQKSLKDMQISLENNIEAKINTAIAPVKAQAEQHELRLDAVDVELAHIQDKLAQATPDPEQQMLELVALEEALMANPLYSTCVVLSNWKGMEVEARLKMINDSLAQIKKRATKIEHLGPGNTLTKVRFEVPESAALFKDHWLKCKPKGPNNAPLYASRDMPKVVRLLRKKLTQAEQTLKRAIYKQDPNAKHQWRINWGLGGILFLDKTEIVRRTAGGQLKWSDEGMKETWEKASSTPEAMIV